MKKAGLSNSKSKTRRTSKSSAVTDPRPLAPFLAVGHRPSQALTPQDETLFRAFQSNLLSLISHELRTPLAGILNALEVLGEGETPPGISRSELLQMARQNAKRLHQTLAALLDLASLESGTFHVRLREVDLVRLIQGRIHVHQSSFKQAQLSCEWNAKSSVGLSPAWVDPQKLSRSVDLCFEGLMTRADPGSQVKVAVMPNLIQITFRLAPAMESQWETAWSESMMGFGGGVSSPYSAFAGVMQSEEAFLSRSREGLGSELLLIHEIMRIHGGKFSYERKGSDPESQTEAAPRTAIILSLQLPEVSSEEGIQAILASRVFRISTEIGSVGLVILPVPEGISVEEFKNRVQKTLFRATDGVFSLPEKRQIALILDDCKSEDVPQLMARISSTLGSTLGQTLEQTTNQTPVRNLPFGASHCPTDGLDPVILLELAEMRLKLEEKTN